MSEGRLHSKKFFEAKTRDDIAELLGIKEKSLRYFLYKRRPENMYKTFEVKKKSGASRKISAPQKELKQIQRKLTSVLSEIYEPKACAYGFIENKNILGNANRHTGRKSVLNIDLKDFFTQIHFGRIRGMLMQKPYSLGDEAATTIAQIACLNGVLPQGAPSSPILSNMICVPLDNNLMRLAKQTGCTYTRYADDITFSTYKKDFPADLAYVENGSVHLGKKLAAAFKNQSFNINPEKITFRSNYVRQEVTGLTVNVFPNVRRSYSKQLRAILHHCDKNGVYSAAQEYIHKGYCKNSDIVCIVDDPQKQDVIECWFQKVLVGKTNYIKQIKGEKSLTFLSFAKKINALFESEIFNITELDRLNAIALNSTFILEYDTDDAYVQGSGFSLAGYGLVTNYHVTENGEFFKVYKPYQTEHCAIIKKELNESMSDKNIDYAFYDISSSVQSHPLALGDSTKLRIGDSIIAIGYPNYSKGDSPYIQECKITSIKNYLGAKLYTISGRIVHGASGGVVLDDNYNVVGIIKGGIASMEESDTSENQGFIPIHLVISDLKKDTDILN